MNKTLERRLQLKSSVGVVDADLSWEKARNRPYLYHVTLTHLPSGMAIEQASESSFADARGYCLGELNWRLRHWAEYQKSRMDDTSL